MQSTQHQLYYDLMILADRQKFNAGEKAILVEAAKKLLELDNTINENKPSGENFRGASMVDTKF